MDLCGMGALLAPTFPELFTQTHMHTLSLCQTHMHTQKNTLHISKCLQLEQPLSPWHIFTCVLDAYWCFGWCKSHASGDIPCGPCTCWHHKWGQHCPIDLQLLIWARCQKLQVGTMDRPFVFCVTSNNLPCMGRPWIPALNALSLKRWIQVINAYFSTYLRGTDPWMHKCLNQVPPRRGCVGLRIQSWYTVSWWEQVAISHPPPHTHTTTRGDCRTW